MHICINIHTGGHAVKMPSRSEAGTAYPVPFELAAASPEARAERLANVAGEIRRSIVEMIGQARLGHIGGDLSVTDILTTLFFGVLHLDPTAPAMPERDRF